MNLNTLLLKIKTNSKLVTFEEVIQIIDSNYEFIPTKFINGELINEAGQNNGSCKIFAFAKLNNLTKEETLNCFGNFYRIDVLQNESGNDHQNIRNFMKFSWKGIIYENSALK